MEILGLCIVTAVSIIAFKGLDITININKTLKDVTEVPTPQFVSVEEIESKLANEEVEDIKVAAALKPEVNIVGEINKFIGDLFDGE